MTDKERLIELLDKADTPYKPKENETYEAYMHDFYGHIAKYLLKHGVAVLPCKVGDLVYQTDGVRVYESKIKTMTYDCGSFAFDENAIGKSVFLTREEAEQALKDGEQNV